MHYGFFVLLVKASITQRLVSSVKLGDSIYDVADDKLTGFILRVYPSGKLVYYVRPRRGSMRKIGNAPAFTPTQAREVAKTVIQSITTGTSHPVLDRNVPIELDPTLRRFIDFEYAPYYKDNHRTTKNLDNLNVLGTLLDRNLSDISTNLVDTWRRSRRRADVAPATINRNVNALRACLSYAVDRGLIPSNPLAGLQRLVVEEENRVRYMDAGEEERLRASLESCGARLRTMILLSINTGIRRGELFSLDWMSVTADTIAVESGKSKNRRTRHIPLNSEARTVLDKWGRQPSGLVFPSESGKQLTDVRKSWVSVLKKAKITNFRWHDLRHHFASKLVMAGIPINSVRELLGHSDIKMTLRYSHLSPGHLRAAVEALNEP